MNNPPQNNSENEPGVHAPLRAALERIRAGPSMQTKRRQRNAERRRRKAEEEANAARQTQFKYDHIFELAGHGSSEAQDIYVLQDNEFYTTPVICGAGGAVGSDKWYTFVTSKPTIHIPTPTNANFFGNSYSTYLQGITIQQLYKNGVPYDKLVYEHHAYKMYVPFASERGSKTIYNTSVQLFDTKHFESSKPADNTFTFTYGDVSKTYTDDELDDFILYKISISGVLPCNKLLSNVELALINPSLKTASATIMRSFLPGVNDSTGFFVCIPPDYDDIIYTPTGDYDDPLVMYLRDVVTAVYSDSVLTPNELYGDDITFRDLWNTIPMSELYPKIRATIHDDEPMIVVNRLCRDYSGWPEYIVNSNENVNLRSFMKRYGKTVRGKRMRTRMLSNLKKYTKRTYGKHIPLSAKHNDDKYNEIMAYVVKHKKITYAKYSASPELYIRHLAHITHIPQTRWRIFLSSLSEEEFYNPNVVDAQ